MQHKQLGGFITLRDLRWCWHIHSAMTCSEHSWPAVDPAPPAVALSDHIINIPIKSCRAGGQQSWYEANQNNFVNIRRNRRTTNDQRCWCCCCSYCCYCDCCCCCHCRLDSCFKPAATWPRLTGRANADSLATFPSQMEGRSGQKCPSQTVSNEITNEGHKDKGGALYRTTLQRWLTGEAFAWQNKWCGRRERGFWIAPPPSHTHTHTLPKFPAALDSQIARAHSIFKISVSLFSWFVFSLQWVYI